MASKEDKSLVCSSATTSIVLFPPTPKTKGNLPLLASITVAITISFSDADKVAFSAVVPRTTRYSIPPSMEKLTIRVNASVSIEKSALKGVTRATPVPINDCILRFYFV